MASSLRERSSSSNHRTEKKFPSFGPFNVYIFLYPNDMIKPKQPLDVNTLNQIYVFEYIVQLFIRLDTKIIANMY